MIEEKNNTVPITFIYSHSGEKVTIQANCGTSVLEAAKENNINIKGSCKGKLRCTTCHVYVRKKKTFKNIPKALPAEQAALMRAKDKKDCSRLCCQLIIDKQIFNKIELVVPESTYSI